MRRLLLLSFILLVLVSVSPVIAQEGSIQNPSFELPYYRVAMSRLDPGGWKIRQLPGQHGIETRPTLPLYPYRTHSGVVALQMFNVFAPINVVVYQSLSVSGGYDKKVDFSCHFHGWYWNPDDETGGPPFEDGRPISNWDVSRGKILILDREPNPATDCPSGVGTVQQDTYRQISDSRTFPPGTRIWVGMCLNSPAGQTNDFYVDDCSISISAVGPVATPVPSTTIPIPVPPSPSPSTTTPTPVWGPTAEPTPTPTPIPTSPPLLQPLNPYSDNPSPDNPSPYEPLSPFSVPGSDSENLSLLPWPSSDTAPNTTPYPINPDTCEESEEPLGMCSGNLYNNLERQTGMGNPDADSGFPRRGIKVWPILMLLVLMAGGTYFLRRK